MYAVDEPPEWDLQRNIGPAEAGENDPQLHRGKVQGPGELRPYDGDVAAIEVIYHHDDEQQHGDEESSPGGCLGYNGRLNQRSLVECRIEEVIESDRGAGEPQVSFWLPRH